MNEPNETLTERIKELEDMREGDFELVRSLAISAGIKITASNKFPGAQWEQFHDGVLELSKLIPEKRRIDYLFSDQTDLIIVDHGVIGPEPGIVVSREDLDRIIKDRQ